MLRAHDWLTRSLVFLVERPALARAALIGMRAAPGLMRALLGVGGGVAIQPPKVGKMVAASWMAPALVSSATDQNAIPSKRVESA